MTVSRIAAIGYLNTADLIWISELQRMQNMGLPMTSFSFQLRGMTAPITAQSHTIQPDRTWVPNAQTAAEIEEAHTQLIRAWEMSVVKP